MADKFQLQGGATVTPQSGNPSGSSIISIPIDESQYLKYKALDEFELTSDAVRTIDFGSVANAHVVMIKLVGGKARVRLTSTDGGAQQAIPVDSFLFLLANSVPITALDITRLTGTTITCKVFLGEKSS